MCPETLLASRWGRSPLGGLRVNGLEQLAGLNWLDQSTRYWSRDWWLVSSHPSL